MLSKSLFCVGFRVSAVCSSNPGLHESGATSGANVNPLTDRQSLFETPSANFDPETPKQNSPIVLTD